MKTYPTKQQMFKFLDQYKKGVMRTTMNIFIKDKKLIGNTLDIGANYSEYPSYYEFFNVDKLTKKTLLDFYKHKKPDVVGDAQNLPFKNKSFDTIICFNLVEHVPDPFKVISEVSRVLKAKGKSYFYAPYLTALHSEQRNYMGDFSRLSHATWSYWIGKYFSKYKIYPVAFGPATQFIVLFEHFIPSNLRVFLSKLAIKFDDWFVKRKPYLSGKYLLAVFVEAVK